MRTYTQLTQEQRYQIYSLMKAGPKHSCVKETATTGFPLTSAPDPPVCMDPPSENL